MNRISRFPKEIREKIAVEKPNWNIQSLYNDRQLVRNKKLTKFFIPYDSVDPEETWQLFVFGEDQSEKTVELKSPTTLIGRESFCDIILTNPTVSRQHCAIQFRSVRSKDEENPQIFIKPYIFDLSSKGGTFIKGERIPPMCFVELQHKDTISFAGSNETMVIMQISFEKEINYDE